MISMTTKHIFLSAILCAAIPAVLTEASVGRWVYNAAFVGQDCHAVCTSVGMQCTAADEQTMTSFTNRSELRMKWLHHSSTAYKSYAVTTSALASGLTCYRSGASSASKELFPFAYVNHVQNGGVDCRTWNDENKGAGSTCGAKYSAKVAHEKVSRICHCSPPTLSPSRAPTGIPTIPTRRNEGANCWNACKKDGRCDWCGSTGYCCRNSGLFGTRNGCWNTAQNHWHHRCQYREDMETEDVDNFISAMTEGRQNDEEHETDLVEITS